VVDSELQTLARRFRVKASFLWELSLPPKMAMNGVPEASVWWIAEWP